MHDSEITTGRSIQTEGKLNKPAPTHDEFGDAYDPLNTAKGIGHVLIGRGGAAVLVVAIIAATERWFMSI